MPTMQAINPPQNNQPKIVSTRSPTPGGCAGLGSGRLLITSVTPDRVELASNSSAYVLMGQYLHRGGGQLRPLQSQQRLFEPLGAHPRARWAGWPATVPPTAAARTAAPRQRVFPPVPALAGAAAYCCQRPRPCQSAGRQQHHQLPTADRFVAPRSLLASWILLPAPPRAGAAQRRQMATSAHLPATRSIAG